MATKENPLEAESNPVPLPLFFLSKLAFCLRHCSNTKMKVTVSFNQKILQHCKKLLIRITRSCPRRHYRHLKLQKASSSSSSSGKKVNKVLSSFFLSFQKKKQKKEKMKRLNELRSFSDSVSEKKTPNPESRKKVFPSSLTPSCLGHGKAHSQEVSQDYDPHRNSTSAFLP